MQGKGKEYEMAIFKYRPKCSGLLRRQEHGKHDMVCTECGEYFTWFQLSKKPIVKCLNCGEELETKGQFCSVKCYNEYLKNKKPTED